MSRSIIVGLLLGTGGCGPPDAGAELEDGVSGDETAFRVVVMADSHLIDEFYTCCEGNDLDTQSLQSSQARLEEVIEEVNALEPAPEALFVAGDVVHEFPSGELSFYQENETSMDLAAEVYGRLRFPAYFAMGNHDYDVPLLDRAETWELAAEKWGMNSTYYAVMYHGFKFIVLDGQLGPTWDVADPMYNKTYASFGDEQLQWLASELADESPAFLLFHHPPSYVRANESDGDLPDLFSVIDTHREQIQVIFTGHMHLWMNTSTVWDPMATSTEDSRVVGYGLAATRYDKRNWWLLELDVADMSWSLPEVDEVTYASYFYDGVEPVDL